LHASVHTVHNMGIFVMRSGAHIRHRGKIAAEIAERVTEIPDHQNHRFFSSNFFFNFIFLLCCYNMVLLYKI
jgi:hypothetical protein